MTDDTPTLDIDPGPALPYTVTMLDTGDELVGFHVDCIDEALARRLIRQKIADEYGTEDGPAIVEQLEHAEVTADTWRWGAPDTEDRTELIGGKHQDAVPGLRFILDLSN